MEGKNRNTKQESTIPHNFNFFSMCFSATLIIHVFVLSTNLCQAPILYQALCSTGDRYRNQLDTGLDLLGLFIQRQEAVKAQSDKCYNSIEPRMPRTHSERTSSTKLIKQIVYFKKWEKKMVLYLTYTKYLLGRFQHIILSQNLKVLPPQDFQVLTQYYIKVTI